MEGGKEAIKVRTIKRKPIDMRWNAEIIMGIRATPKHLNPKDRQQSEVNADETLRVIDIGGNGAQLEEAIIKEEEKKLRDFKIARAILEKFGHTPSCFGCEGSLVGTRRVHSSACRRRLEYEIRRDEVEKRRIENRDLRLGRKADEDKDGEVPKESSGSDDPNVIQTDEKMPDQVEESSDDEEGEEKEDDRRNDKKKREDFEREEEQRRLEEDLFRSDSEPPSPTERGRLEQVKQLRGVIAQCRRRRIGERSREYEVDEFVKEFVEKKVKQRANDLDISSVIMAVAEKEKYSMDLYSPHESEEAENMRWEAMYQDMEFYDDENSGTLDKGLVVAARRLEI